MLRVVLIAVLAGCSGSSQGRAHVFELLRDLRSQIELAAGKDSASLTQGDVELLDRAHVDRERFAGRDLAAFVLLLRFSESLRETDLPAVEDFGASEDGIEVRWLLAFLLIDKDRLDGAARLIVAALVQMPADNRAYRLWKWWEWSFGPRPDLEMLTRRLSHALLRRFEQGDATERAVVADLFGNPGMTESDLPAMRASIDGK